MMHSNRLGKVDPLCGKKGMVVSLDQEEYSKFAETYNTPRIPGDDGPGELVQPFDEGTSWNVRWIRTGRVGTYYTGAYKLYHVRMGANDTDKTEVDLVMRDIRFKMEGVGDLHSTMPSRGTPSIMLKIPETAGGQQ
uniref:Uncharacterized protein n=1 Tax=Hemiselmis tepida TaxID=464990 RepID=A0A7S0VUE1_9CRYP|mmetsp:Transcript_25084/g.63625  ORF Transcript_25084/g.63625 Transcript_25084/m.63625 type:complete len:136 (+) Transcript_25084:150-557(+)